MYTFYPHITSLYSSVGFPWLLFFLLACAVVTKIAYPAFLSDSFSVIFSKISRRYSDAARLTPFVSSLLFTVGSFALCLWLCSYSSGALHWLQYALLFALVAMWMFVRFLVTRFIGYVFSIYHEAQALQEDSLSLLLLASVCVFIPCCMAIVLPAPDVLPLWSLIVFAFYIIALTGKMVVSFARSFKSLFYIGLYVMTLEIIPMAFLYGAASRISLIV